MENEEIYRKWAIETFIHNKTTTNAISQRFATSVMNFLKHGIVEERDIKRNSNFRYKVKYKKYKVVMKDGKDILVIPQKGNEKVKYKKYKVVMKDGKDILVIPQKGNEKEMLYVAFVENFYETIKNVHETTGHAGINVVEKVIHKAYYGIPRKAIGKFISMCEQCKSKTKPVRRKIIQSSAVLERIQVDFIDMVADEVEGFRWIISVEDHFSRFQWLFPLKSKTSNDINMTLLSLFGMIGLPNILQTNNVPEFGDLKSLLELWPGNKSLIHDIQGIPPGMEGKGFVVEKLKSYDSQYNGHRPAPWHKWLPSIAYTHNTSFNEKIKMSPYKCMYGREADSTPVVHVITVTTKPQSMKMEVHNDHDYYEDLIP